MAVEFNITENDVNQIFERNDTNSISEFFADEIDQFIKGQKSINPDIRNYVNEHFWELV